MNVDRESSSRIHLAWNIFPPSSKTHLQH